MFYALSWFVVFALVALWSLAVWALHGVAVWTVTHAGALSGAAAGAAGLRLPDWLAPWVPPELAQAASAVAASLAPVIDSLLQAVPALAGGVTVASWVVWGIGSALLVLLGVGLHVVVALWRRPAGGSSSGGGRALAAG